MQFLCGVANGSKVLGDENEKECWPYELVRVTDGTSWDAEPERRVTARLIWVNEFMEVLGCKSYTEHGTHLKL